MSEKKRKRTSDPNGHAQSKTLSQHSSTAVAVRYHRSDDTDWPVIATSPGTSLASFLEFKSYVKESGGQSQCLLHASNHPSLDYTATEADSPASQHLKHYVAVYDPKSRQLDVTEAREMTVRRKLVDEEPHREENGESKEDEEPISPFKGMKQRAALAHAFGTKRAKKYFENSQIEMSSREHDSKPLSEAILASMPAIPVSSAIPGSEALSQNEILQAAKPLPKPNLQATKASGAYPLSNLVFPAPHEDTLALMPVDDWRRTVSSGKAVQTTSRFIARCVTPITQAAIKHPSPTSRQTTKLKLLRYILLLIEFSRILTPGRRLPPPSEWNTPKNPITDYDSLPRHLLDSLVTKYCTDPSMRTPAKSYQHLIPTKFNQILLQTTILALTLHIPPPNGHGPSSAAVLVTDHSYIQLDLALKSEDSRKFFRQLGCKMEKPNDDDLKNWGIRADKPAEGKSKIGQVTKLRLPLDFPPIARGRA